MRRRTIKTWFAENDLDSKLNLALQILFFVACVFQSVTHGYLGLIAYIAWLVLLIYKILRDIRHKTFGVWSVLYIVLAICAAAAIVVSLIK